MPYGRKQGVSVSLGRSPTSGGRSPTSGEAAEAAEAATGKQIALPGNDPIYAALAANAYADSRSTKYKALRGLVKDEALSDGRSVVYKDPKSNNVYWGVAGSQSAKDAVIDTNIIAQKALNILPRTGDAVVGGAAPKTALALKAAMAGLNKLEKVETKRVASTYAAIKTKYPGASVKVGTHSLGAHLTQSLLQRLTIKQRRKIQVHAFNPFNRADFDPDQYGNSYFSTRTQLDPASIGSYGMNQRVIESSRSNPHAITNFVGKDLTRYEMGLHDRNHIDSEEHHSLAARASQYMTSAGLAGILGMLRYQKNHNRRQNVLPMYNDEL